MSTKAEQSVEISTAHHEKHASDFEAPTEHLAELEAAEHVNLSWKTWVVVFVCCFAIMGQVYVVVAAGSVIAFIIRDLGNPTNAGWIIQGPLLMQAVLSPSVGRLSDVIDRKYLVAVPPLIAFVGAVVCATAKSMDTLIGGGILIGVTLSTCAIVQAIPSEILPMKYRALANGLAFIGGSLGGLTGALSAGGLTNARPSGWRDIFWMQAAFHGLTFLGYIIFYRPQKSDYPKMSLKEYIWAIDPIGSVLFVLSTTLLLLGLNWAGGIYDWDSPRVIACLVVGFVSLAAFGAYEWKGRSDGLVAHAFFRGSPNFALSVFAFTVEGWLFYSAVNSITPQIVLRMGWATNSWAISIRQLSFQLPNLFGSVPIIWYSTKYKDLKSPLLVTFTLFLIVTILYANLKPEWNHPQYGFNVLSGIGQAGPLTLLVALVQFTAPHAFLSTATGLAFSARAIGGAFGSAALDAIINSKLEADYAKNVGGAAVKAGLDSANVPALVAGLMSGQGLDEIPGLSPEILGVAAAQSAKVYASAFRLAWASIIPFTFLAIVAVAMLKGVRELMTEKVEATVERIPEKNAA